MKRILAVVAVITLLGPGLAEAQVSVGLRGGLTRTRINLQEEESDEFRWRNGFLVGGFVQAPMNETFGIQVGARFTRKGGEILARNGFLRVDLDYLSVPGLGVLTVPLSGPWAAKLMGGAVVSFQLACKRHAEIDGESVPTVDCEESGIDTKSVDLGVQLGGGLAYELRNAVALFLDVGFELGLINQNPTPRFGESARNRALLVSVGVDVPIR